MWVNQYGLRRDGKITAARGQGKNMAIGAKTPIIKIHYSGSQLQPHIRIFNLGRLKKPKMITSSGHYGVTGPRLLFLLQTAKMSDTEQLTVQDTNPWEKGIELGALWLPQLTSGRDSSGCYTGKRHLNQVQQSLELRRQHLEFREAMPIRIHGRETAEQRKNFRHLRRAFSRHWLGTHQYILVRKLPESKKNERIRQNNLPSSQDHRWSLLLSVRVESSPNTSQEYIHQGPRPN